MSKRSEIMDALLQHLADEVEIDEFHTWISEVCDPDAKIVQLAKEKHFTTIEEDFLRKTSHNDQPGKYLIPA